MCRKNTEQSRPMPEWLQGIGDLSNSETRPLVPKILIHINPKGKSNVPPPPKGDITLGKFAKKKPGGIS